MIKKFGKKTLSIFCALLIVISATVSALTLSVVAAEPITQSFETDYSVADANSGFSIYTAVDNNDTNVKDGTKSLKWTATSGSKVVTLWSTGKELTVGETYKMEAWVKAVTSGGSEIKFTQLNAKSNGWSYGTNTQYGLPYFGTSYDSVGEWKKFEITFTAEKTAMGILLYGADTFYFDSITWTPVLDEVTVNVEANNGETVEALKGAPGAAMTLPTVTKEGMDFVGWYTDAELKTPLENTAAFPEESITVYAKWIESGKKIQDFEIGYSVAGTSSGFSVYTAVDNNDTNVKDGTKSLKWTATSGSKAITLWSTGKELTVGETYKMEVWIKAETSGGSGISFTQLNDKTNGWSYSTNTQYGLPYFGTSYDSVGEWKKFEITFTAEKTAMGILIYGADTFYFDSITWTPVLDDVTVNVEANNGETVEALKGAPGAAMTLPTVTKEGMDFVGWYTDAELKTPLENTSSFPEKSITVYAKWIESGKKIQDFEIGYSVADANSGFSIYTAVDNNDTNVKDGTKSLKWTATSGSKAITLWSTGKELTVGETYKMEAWIKAETSGGSGISFTQLNDKTNGWSYSTNTQYGLPYFGTSYDSVGEWKKFEITFTAEKTAMGILLYGADTFYFDEISWSPVNADIEVSIETNNGETVEALKGAEGMSLSLPSLTKEGYYFAGWFTDADFTNSFTQTTFPEASTTLYAKWIENGLITQNFESYTYSFSANAGFELYTAENSEDNNAFEGKHSLYRNGINNTKVAALTDQYTTLTVGKAYKVTFNIKVTDLGTGGGLDFTNLTVRDNPWSYTRFMSMAYIGADYKYLNEWTEYSYIFVAEAPYYGMASWGNITYYVDNFKLVEVPIVTVSFEMGEGQAIEPITGAAGADMTVENPTPPEGKAFGGWYADAEFTERYTIKTYPDKDITIYARWIKAGTYEQDYETWPDEKGVYLTSNVFSLYTAKDENDPNVYSGKHSMFYDNPETSKTYALGIFDTEMGELVVGEKYYVSIRFKPVKFYSYSNTNRSYTYHTIYYTKQQSNVWTYQSQGPIGRYTSDLFDKSTTKVSDDYWTGTTNMVTTSKEKDENGWLTMTYEFTAPTKYIALYMAGNYSMYIDYITIEPLPSGVISENYSNPYCEDFYNILADFGLSDRPNSEETGVYKLELDPRGDYVFTASLMQGAYGASKVYLATDSEGKNPVPGTVFEGNGTEYKLYSSRIMTDLTGVFYLVVQGGGAGSSNYFVLFPTKYGCEENPNPEYTYKPIDYLSLPEKPADVFSTDTSEDETTDNNSSDTELPDDNSAQDEDVPSNDNLNDDSPESDVLDEDASSKDSDSDILSDDSSENEFFGDDSYSSEQSPSTGDTSLLPPMLVLLLTSCLSLFVLRKRGAVNEK